MESKKPEGTGNGRGCGVALSVIFLVGGIGFMVIGGFIAGALQFTGPEAVPMGAIGILVGIIMTVIGVLDIKHRRIRNKIAALEAQTARARRNRQRSPEVISKGKDGKLGTDDDISSRGKETVEEADAELRNSEGEE